MKSILAPIIALVLATPVFGGMEWTFPVDNKPGGATITLGGLGSGWHAADATSPWNYGAAPGATGFWDLGTTGSILLTGVGGSGLTTLNVFQFVGAGYDGTLNWTVAGGEPTRTGSLAPLMAVTPTLDAPGVWWEYTANLGTLLPADTVTISAGAGGAIIDRLTLVPEPATLIAGAVLLIPFALSTWPMLRRRRSK